MNDYLAPSGTPASKYAESTQQVTLIISYIGVFFFVLICALMLYFVVAYRRRSEDDVTPHITHNTLLEIVWSIIPLLIVFCFFYLGAIANIEQKTPPPGAINIDVTASKWKFDFNYPGYGVVSNKNISKYPNDNIDKKKNEDISSPNYLTVPVGQPIVLRITAKAGDVIHSFGIRDLAIKQDAIPSQIRSVWFIANKTGIYRYNCYENCGKDHSSMSGFIRVVTQEEYDKFLANLKNKKKTGSSLFSSNCTSCHIPNNNTIAPLLQNFADDIKAKKNHPIEGSVITSDKHFEYFKESLRKPNAKYAQGYQGKAMTSFANFSDEDIKLLYDYIRNDFKDVEEDNETTEDTEGAN